MKLVLGIIALFIFVIAVNSGKDYKERVKLSKFVVDIKFCDEVAWVARKTHSYTRVKEVFNGWKVTPASFSMIAGSGIGDYKIPDGFIYMMISKAEIERTPPTAFNLNENQFGEFFKQKCLNKEIRSEI